MDEAVGALDAFRQRAVADRALRERLRGEADPDRFAVLVVALAAVEGIDVPVEVVRAELTAARQRWDRRWL